MAGEIGIELIGPTGADDQEMQAFRQTLSAADIRFGQMANVRKSAGSGGGTEYLPFFQVAAPFAAPLIAAFGGWFAGRAGRRVRLKIGEIEAEAGSVEEVERLLDLAARRQDKN